MGRATRLIYSIAVISQHSSETFPSLLFHSLHLAPMWDCRLRALNWSLVYKLQTKKPARVITDHRRKTAVRGWRWEGSSQVKGVILGCNPVNAALHVNEMEMWRRARWEQLWSFPDSPSAGWVLVVERLVDDAHHWLAAAPQKNPDQDQSAVEAWREEAALLQHLLPTLDVLAGGILGTNERRELFISAVDWVAAGGANGRSPIGSIQMPRSEGLRGTVRASAWASAVTGSRWMARASREAAVWLLSSTDASSVAVSPSVLHTVTVTLSPGETFNDFSTSR